MQLLSQGIKILHGKKTKVINSQFIGNSNHLIALITTENK